MLEERAENTMNWFEENKDVLSFTCKFNHLSSLLFRFCHVLKDGGKHFNNIHDIVSKLVEYNKDINFFSEEENNYCFIAIVFFRNGDYTKDFLNLILDLKNELLSYEKINFVKIIPI